MRVFGCDAWVGSVMREYEDHLRSVAAVLPDLSMGLDLVIIWLFDSRISLSRLLS